MKFNIIRADFARYIALERGSGPVSLRKRIRVFLTAYGFHATVIYRFKKWLDRPRYSFRALVRPLLSLLYSLANSYSRIAYGIEIHPEAEIGRGFYIGHFGGIFVGKVLIGENCSISQHVKISRPGDEEVTVRIGNNVWIGSHARIEESVVIGDGATIGAGAVVVADVAPKNLVLGKPARVINTNYDNSSLLSFKAE